MNATLEKERELLSPALLDVFLDLFRRMIEAGAEIYRVEEAIERVCTAYGASRTEAYATTSHIVISVELQEGVTLTDTRRIKSARTDIEQLDRLNTLLRRMCTERPDRAEIERALNEATHAPAYPGYLTVLSYGVIAAAFCLFFGARTGMEALVAFFIGLAVGGLCKLIERPIDNKLMQRFLCSLLASVLAFTCLRLSLIASVDKVIIGNIMSLIPGIGLTNAIRDLFAGDSITGILRAIEAVLLALAIAAGYILAAYLFGGVV